MKITLLKIAGMLCAFTAWVSATEPYKLDLTGSAFPQRAKGTPDHLQPSRIKVPEFYYLAQYTSFPSFEAGLYLEVERNMESGQFWLKACALIDKHPFYLAKGAPKEEFSKPPAYTKSLEISEELAEAVYDLWANALFEVRYPKTSSLGMDGTTHVFSTFVRGLG